MANEMKKLTEQRASLMAEMQKLISGSKEELRSLTDEEQTRFDEIEEEIRAIDATVKAEQRAAELSAGDGISLPADSAEDRTAAEERAFVGYVTGVAENRADVNLTASDNGAVIPASIVDKIISKVKEISPLFNLATKYNVGGTLSIPYYDESTQSLQCLMLPSSPSWKAQAESSHLFSWAVSWREH